LTGVDGEKRGFEGEAAEGAGRFTCNQRGGVLKKEVWVSGLGGLRGVLC